MRASRIRRNAVVFALAMIAPLGLAGAARASTLVTYYDQDRNFEQYSVPIETDAAFAGTSITFGGRSLTGRFGEHDPENWSKFYTATDSGRFQIYTYFDHPLGVESSPADPFRFFVLLAGTFQGDLNKSGGTDRLGGSYSGRVDSIQVSGTSIDGRNLQLLINDPAAVVDPTFIARLVEGTNIPASLVDAYLHLDRYSISGQVGGGHFASVNLALNLAAGPMYEPVPEPATYLSFLALAGGLAYRRLRSAC